MALIAIVVVVTVYLSTFTGDADIASTPKKETLRVGFVPSAFYLPLAVAIEHGFFDEEGFHVVYVRFESVKDQSLALVNGNVDVSGIGSGGAFALESSSPNSIKLIYGQNMYGYSFVVKNGSKISSLSQLRGKTIGTWPSPTSKLLIELILNHLNVSEVMVHQLDASLMNNALEEGKVDALFTSDIYLQTGLHSGTSKYLERDPVTKYLFNPFFNGGGIVSNKLVEQNPNKSLRIKRAVEKAIFYIKNNERESRRAILKYIPVPVEIALQAPLDNFYTLSEVNASNAQQVADLFYESKLLQKRVNASQMFWSGD